MIVKFRPPPAIRVCRRAFTGAIASDGEYDRVAGLVHACIVVRVQDAAVRFVEAISFGGLDLRFPEMKELRMALSTSSR